MFHRPQASVQPPIAAGHDSTPPPSCHHLHPQPSPLVVLSRRLTTTLSLHHISSPLPSVTLTLPSSLAVSTPWQSPRSPSSANREHLTLTCSPPTSLSYRPVSSAASALALPMPCPCCVRFPVSLPFSVHLFVGVYVYFMGNYAFVKL